MNDFIEFDDEVTDEELEWEGARRPTRAEKMDYINFLRESDDPEDLEEAEKLFSQMT